MSFTTRRMSSSKLTAARVVISPNTITKPVLTAVSQATRLCGSWVRQASSTASLIWSHILSGWPSVTDSEVNMSLGAVINVVLISLSPYNKIRHKAPLAVSGGMILFGQGRVNEEGQVEGGR